MCYSFEVSVSTFLIGLTFSVINLIKYRNPIYVCLSLFWLVVIFMQLWESLLWKNYKCELVSKLAMVNNLIQPLVLLLVLLIPNYLKNNSVNLPLVGLTILIYLGYISKYFKKDYGCIKEKNGIHLKWWDMYGAYLFIIVGIILFKLILPTKIGYIQMSLFIYSLIIVNIFYEKNSIYNRYGRKGSIWCWAAAFIPLVNYFVFKNNL